MRARHTSHACGPPVRDPPRNEGRSISKSGLHALYKARGNKSVDEARVQAGDEQDACMSEWRRDRRRRPSRLQQIQPSHADMAISRRWNRAAAVMGGSALKIGTAWGSAEWLPALDGRPRAIESRPRAVVMECHKLN